MSHHYNLFFLTISLTLTEGLILIDLLIDL